MFYSRRENGSSLLRFLVMFVVALGLAFYFFATDTGYDRAGVMLAAATLCGANVLWQARRFESVDAVKEEVLHSLRKVWR